MGAALGARLVLAVVFAVAGVAKLVDAEGSRRAVEGFGVPSRLAGLVGWFLPAAELVLAVALLVPGLAWEAAAGAASLLGLFVVAISVSLCRGRTNDCHCFGQLHSRPVGPGTLARNVLLAALSVVVLVAGPSGQPSVFGWLSGLTGVEVALGVAVVVLGFVCVAGGWFLFELLRQNGRILARLDSLEARLRMPGARDGAPGERALNVQNGHGPHIGLAVGTVAPGFELPLVGGGFGGLSDLLTRSLPVLLVFSDPGCGPCNALTPKIAAWQLEHRERLAVAVVSRGSVDENSAKVQEHGLTDVFLQADREVAQAYDAHGTPSAIVIDAKGMIQSPVAAGADAIGALVARAVAAGLEVFQVPHTGLRPPMPAPGPMPVRRLTVGTQVPDLEWEDIDGGAVALRDTRGSTVVLFWNPQCGFCERLLPEIRQYELARRHDHPRLLVISTGSEDENRAMALQAPVVVEDGFETGRVFGVSGTPSAVLIDADGHVASQVSLGGPAILELMSRRSDGLTVA